MWIVIKYKTNNLDLLKSDLNKKLKSTADFYLPKIQMVKSSFQKKIIKSEFKILGDYIFCYHQSFSDKKILNLMNYVKGTKCFLKDYFSCQKEIKEFILKCKQNEDEKGYLKQSFFKFQINKRMKFLNGPFANMIFNIIEVQKNKLKILLDGKNTVINKKNYLFSSI